MPLASGTMQAMVIDHFGGPESLYLAEVPIPEPQANEVLIQVAYAGVNPADWKCREGWLSQYFNYTFPFIIGFDAAGIVAKVGPGVTNFKAGDRVVTYSNQGRGEWGSYAEFVKSFTGGVAHLNSDISFCDAAAIPTAGGAAWEGLFDTCHIIPSQSILIHGGSGGVGSLAIQLAKYTGARVAATCGTANLDYIKSLGADLAIDYHEENIKSALQSWAPAGVEAVLDAVGQGTLLNSPELVKPGGTVGFIATLIAGEPLPDIATATRRGVKLARVISTYERSGDQLNKIVDLFNQKKLQFPAIEVFPLTEAAEAHLRIQSGHVRGKLVLQVSDL